MVKTAGKSSAHITSRQLIESISTFSLILHAQFLSDAVFNPFFIIILMHYLEKLRKEKMKGGRCEICFVWENNLEAHHENYKPERTIYLCHKCHHKVHFLPWQLTEYTRKKLLKIRHGYGVTISDEMARTYIPPGRRPAQLEVRKKTKKEIKKSTLV